MSNRIIAAALLLMSVMSANAQGVPFNGYVCDLNGQPLKKVMVWTADAERYALSDKKGRFGLTDVQANDTVHLKYHKKMYDIPVEGRKSLRVIVSLENVFANEDQEFVDIGYGYVSKRESLGSHTGISGDELRKTGKDNLLEALSGRVPGLFIRHSVFPGDETSALLRGPSSINAPTAPLYLVDGVEVESLGYVNIYTVDYVEVLKDSNIYGAKGANGVISVHTKK